MKIFNLKNLNLNYFLQTELVYFVAFAPILNLFVIYTSHQNSVLYLGQFIGLLYMIFVPGLYFLPLITNKKFPFSLGLVYSAGISVFLLMFIGLIINTFLPLLGIDDPLSKIPLLITFDFLLIILFLLNAIYNKHFILEVPNFNKIDLTIIFSSFFIPLLVCLGAISLNNDGNNYFTISALILVSLVFVFLTLKREKLNSEIYPIILYIFALSFLLMNAMRGWFVTGHDILLEFHVFNLTKDFNLWKMAFYKDPYNACLSLTILPNYFYKLLHLNELYVYKFFIHFIGAFPVVIVYYLSKIFTKENIALLVGFVYITFPTYMIDMAFLNRQGIAFVFFGLIIYNIINDTYFTPKIRITMLLLFGTGMVFSHYSTSYIAVPLFIGAYVINKFLKYVVSLDGPFWLIKITGKMKNKEVFHKKELIPLTFVIGLMVIMITWSTFVTKTSSSFVNTIEQIVASLKDPFSLEDQTGPARYSLVTGDEKTPEELLEQFIKDNIKEHNVIEKQSEFYPLTSTQKYPAFPVPEKLSSLTDFGEKIQKLLPVSLHTIYLSIKQIYAGMLQVLIFIGLFGLSFGYAFKKFIGQNVPSEYLAICFSGILVMVAQTVLPSSVINYGLLRLFQQNLLFLSLPIVLGFAWIFGYAFKKFNKQYGSIVIVLLAFFLVLSGFITELTGGTRALLHLSNSGLYYDSYLVHAEEVQSAKWISQYSGTRLPVQAAHFSDIKMIAYGKMAPYIELLPETTKRQSFVYLNYDNVKTSNILEIVYGDVIYYRFPMDFLNNNKNKIYNNGGSEIFR